MPLRAKRICTVLIWTAAFFLFSARHCSAEMRIWTDARGDQASAEFVEYNTGFVYLKDLGGKTGKFPIAKFAEPDQKYIRDLGAFFKKQKAGEPAEPPADPRLVPVVASVNGIPAPMSEFAIRKWSDTQGTAIQAKLVSVDDTRVYIAKDKQPPVGVPYSTLSEEDQTYVKVQLKSLNWTEQIAKLESAPAGEDLAATDPAKPAAAPPAPSAIAPPNAPTTGQNVNDRLAEANRRHVEKTAELQRRREELAAKQKVAEAVQRREQLALQQKLDDDLAARMAEEDTRRAAQKARWIEQTALRRAEQAAQSATSSSPPPAEEPPAANATLPAAQTQPQLQQVNICQSCKKQISNNLTAGDKCPHCGVYLNYDETNGKKSSGGRFVITGVIICVVVGAIIALFKKMTG